MDPRPHLATRLRHRAIKAYLDGTSQRLQGPSYTYKSLEAARIRRRMRDLGSKDPAFAVDAKDDAHVWLEGLGVRRPTLMASFDHPREIVWDALPDEVVVKPARGTVSRGVFLLSRRDRGWFEIAHGIEVTSEQVAHELGRLFDEGRVRGPVLVEELVNDPRRPDGGPIDYKVHAFFGRVGLIECVRRGPAGEGSAIDAYHVYDETWQPLGNLFVETFHDPSIPPPRDPGPLLELARRVSSAIPRPYLRIDLMEDAEGPVVGEVTPEPGGRMAVDRTQDRRLGELWEEAEARLRVRAARSGLLDPVTEALPEAALASSGDGPPT